MRNPFQFLSREQGKEQLASPDEIARNIRSTLLDMMQYGVSGSNNRIPTESQQGAIPLPTLLRYSQKTLAHYKTLQGILRAPRDFSIVDADKVDDSGYTFSEEPETPDGDILKQDVGDGQLEYQFAHHLTSPFMNGFAAAVDTLSKEKPYLGVTIAHIQRDDLWKVYYGFSKYYSTNIYMDDYLEKRKQSLFSSIGEAAHSKVFPDKNALLTMAFSLKSCTPEDLLSLYFNPSTQHMISFVERKIVGKFEVTTFVLHAQKALEYFKKDDDRHRTSREALFKGNEPEIAILEERGDIEFSIVKLGIKTIGTSTYHVYSGSELPLAEQKVLSITPSSQSLKILHPIPTAN